MKICVRDVIYPFEYRTKYIRSHIKQEEELKSILGRSGYLKEFIRKYRLRLKHLNDRKDMCVLKSDWFESLKGNNKNLYSMKIKGRKNIRVIFSFYELKNYKLIILLASFEEKDSSDYIKSIKLAKERFEEIKLGGLL